MAKRNISTAKTVGTEEDYRVRIFNSLLITPHRKIEDTLPFHNEIMATDPIFYGKLADWYINNGSIRDHFEVFICTLFLSEIPEHREAAFMYLQNLPLHQVSRVVTHLVKIYKASCGYYLPRQVKTAIVTYLRRLENDDAAFDRAVLQNKRHLKGLYKGLHLKASHRAQSILFEDNPPEDSLVFVLKQIAKTEDPNAQAELIVKHKIPYTTAVGVVKNMTPAVLVALINSMSPQQLANNIKSLEAHGAYNSSEIKELVKSKLKKGGSKIAAGKAKHAESSDSDIRQAVEKAATSALRVQGGVIKSRVAVLVDISGSMSQAIEAVKMIGPSVAAACTEMPEIYVFNTAATRIEVAGKELADFERAFKHVHAGGGTSIGSGLYALLRANKAVDKLLIITDQGETSSPYFHAIYPDYRKAMGISPDVVIVNVGHASDHLVRNLKPLDVNVETVTWNGDQYGVTNLIQMLSKKSQLDLVMDIMERVLPVRPKNLDVLVRPAKYKTAKA